MKDEKPIPEIRKFIQNGLKIRLTPGTEEDLKQAAQAYKKAVDFIPHSAIQFLIDHPNAKLEIHKIKPKPSNVLPNAN